MKRTRHEDYETFARTLEAVASRYPVGSKEFETTKLAALALFFAMVHQPKDFSTFMKSLERSLTDKEREFLKKCELS